MKGLKQTSRDLIAWVSVTNPDTSFHTLDVPEHLRKSLSGLVIKDFLTSVRDESEYRTYRITDSGLSYATRYAADEQAAFRGIA